MPQESSHKKGNMKCLLFSAINKRNENVCRTQQIIQWQQHAKTGRGSETILTNCTATIAIIIIIIVIVIIFHFKIWIYINFIMVKWIYGVRVGEKKSFACFMQKLLHLCTQIKFANKKNVMFT
jgi:hypothetical protein